MSPLHFSHLAYVADLLSSLRPQYCCRHPCEISVSVLTHNCIQTCDFDCWDICGVLQLQNCCFRMFILGVVSRVCVVGQLQMHLMEFCVTIFLQTITVRVRNRRVPIMVHAIVDIDSPPSLLLFKCCISAFPGSPWPARTAAAPWPFVMWRRRIRGRTPVRPSMLKAWCLVSLTEC